MAVKATRCSDQTYCLNGGTCYDFESHDLRFCLCPGDFTGRRCDKRDVEVHLVKDESRPDDTSIVLIIIVCVLVITGIILFTLFCVFRSKRIARRRKQKQEAISSVGGRDSTNHPDIVVQRAKVLVDKAQQTLESSSTNNSSQKLKFHSSDQKSQSDEMAGKTETLQPNDVEFANSISSTSPKISTTLPSIIADNSPSAKNGVNDHAQEQKSLRTKSPDHVSLNLDLNKNISHQVEEEPEQQDSGPQPSTKSEAFISSKEPTNSQLLPLKPTLQNDQSSPKKMNLLITPNGFVASCTARKRLDATTTSPATARHKSKYDNIKSADRNNALQEYLLPLRKNEAVITVSE